jgi:hypothetical protein
MIVRSALAKVGHRQTNPQKNALNQTTDSGRFDVYKTQKDSKAMAEAEWTPMVTNLWK